MNVRMLAKYWRTILVVAEMNIRQQMTDGFILFTVMCAPNHLRYPLLGTKTTQIIGAHSSPHPQTGADHRRPGRM